MADARSLTPSPDAAALGAVPPLTEHDAARYLGVTVARLQASRLRSGARCDGPPYVLMGHTVRYLVADLDHWLAARRVVPAVVRGPRPRA